MRALPPLAAPLPLHETVREVTRPTLLDRMGRPHVMSQEQARAQGIFIPNWWIAILLIPLCVGVLWVVMTLTAIQANQTALRETLEFRLREAETQLKLNDERWRQTEKDMAEVRGQINRQQQRRAN